MKTRHFIKQQGAVYCVCVWTSHCKKWAYQKKGMHETSQYSLTVSEEGRVIWIEINILSSPPWLRFDPTWHAEDLIPWRWWSHIFSLKKTFELDAISCSEFSTRVHNDLVKRIGNWTRRTWKLVSKVCAPIIIHNNGSKIVCY